MNVALAALLATPALIGLRFEQKMFVPYLGIGVFVTSCLLLFYYNRKMSHTRDYAAHIVRWFKGRRIDYSAIAGFDVTRNYQRGDNFYFHEIILFMLILFGSAVTIFLSMLFTHGA